MDAPSEAAVEVDESVIPDGCVTMDSPVTGSVWKIEVTAGTRIASGTTALILEAMKMEVSVEADESVEIVELLVVEGASVRAGQALVIVRPS
jgi:urea carboxylase